MIDNIKDKIMGKRKRNVNLTLDIGLLARLEKYKVENNISQLSPMVNEMLLEWINQQEKKEEVGDSKNHKE